ncbi:MAG: tRNA 2-thiouridine(34) synthase MnmA, partial [Bacilli bacterium]
MKTKVMIGLSGGVDSAVAAYLLKEQGYEVIAAFMRNWDAMTNNDVLGNPTIDDPQCPQEKDYEDALDVAQKLDIPLLRIDFVKEYWDDVFS